MGLFCAGTTACACAGAAGALGLAGAWDVAVRATNFRIARTGEVGVVGRAAAGRGSGFLRGLQLLGECAGTGMPIPL